MLSQREEHRRGTRKGDTAYGAPQQGMHCCRLALALIYIRDFLGHEDIKTTEILRQSAIAN